MDTGLIQPVLLALLTIPLVFGYRILPVTGTPYIYFNIYFLLIGTYLAAHVTHLGKFFDAKMKNWQTIFTVVILTMSLFGVMITAIMDRGKTAPGQPYGVHDVVLQLESSLQFLSSGRNPYTETYENTPLKDWVYEEMGKRTQNPALFHNVMLPWYLIYSFPFYFVSMRTLGYFDGRMPLAAILMGLTVLLLLWFRKRPLGLLAITLLLLNPATAAYTVEGRSDMMALAFFAGSLYFLTKKKWLISSFVFALAIGTKQTIWFAVPFFLFALWFMNGKSLKKIVTPLVLMTLTLVVLFGPFILWNAKGFLDSTVFYLSGNAANGYPVSGYGLGMILVSMGIIRDIHAYYPFILWQALFGLPVLFFSIKWLSGKLVMSRLLYAYAFTLTVFWWSSRYFNNSHAAFIMSLVTLGIILSQDEKGEGSGS